MASAWISHVKAFAVQHKMKYGDALKNPECKSSYHSGNRKGGRLVNTEVGTVDIPDDIPNDKANAYFASIKLPYHWRPDRG